MRADLGLARNALHMSTLDVETIELGIRTDGDGDSDVLHSMVVMQEG
jgi:hypothetical protein